MKLELQQLITLIADFQGLANREIYLYRVPVAGTLEGWLNKLNPMSWLFMLCQKF